MANAVAPVILLALLTVLPKVSDRKEQALSALGSRYSDTRWQLERPILAELTGDGIQDLAVQGRRGTDLAVGVAIGPLGSKSLLLRMVWRSADNIAPSECLRKATAVLVTEPLSLPSGLWGCATDESPVEFCNSVRALATWLSEAGAKGTQGLRVTGAECDEVHFYWSPQSEQFDYWKAG